MSRRIHKDCPFTAEEIDEFHAMLYNVHTPFPCITPAPVSWLKGFQNHSRKYSPNKGAHASQLILPINAWQ